MRSRTVRVDFLNIPAVEFGLDLLESVGVPCRSTSGCAVSDGLVARRATGAATRQRSKTCRASLRTGHDPRTEAGPWRSTFAMQTDGTIIDHQEVERRSQSPATHCPAHRLFLQPRCRRGGSRSLRGRIERGAFKGTLKIAWIATTSFDASTPRAGGAVRVSVGLASRTFDGRSPHSRPLPGGSSQRSSVLPGTVSGHSRNTVDELLRWPRLSASIAMRRPRSSRVVRSLRRRRPAPPDSRSRHPTTNSSASRSARTVSSPGTRGFSSTSQHLWRTDLIGSHYEVRGTTTNGHPYVLVDVQLHRPIWSRLDRLVEINHQLADPESGHGRCRCRGH